MKILVAEDSLASRCALESMLVDWGFDVCSAEDGAQAWGMFQSDPSPGLAILDWMMPELDGLELCRRIRAEPRLEMTYVILLTARVDQEDILAGLKGGADDYLTKPVNQEELRARINTGRRMVSLQRSLADQVRILEDVLGRVDQLQGLLPICSYCKKIRDDQNYWQQVEAYFSAHTSVQFSHGICPDCYEKNLAQV